MLNESVNTSDIVKTVKGHVTVELFDAKTGELIHKQEKDNFISLYGQQYLQYLQRIDFRDQISVLNGAAADTDYPIATPFDYVALTDSTNLAAPADEWMLPGTLIGYSTKQTYSGPDVYRGTPNQGLCESTDTYTKWVFDWPTQAALGNIGSVAWNIGYAAVGGDTYRGAFPTQIVQNSRMMSYQISPFAAARPIAYANSNLIFSGNATTVTVHDASLTTITTFTTISASGIAWDSVNSKLWVISGNQIASYNQTGTLIDGPINITARAYSGLTFDGTNLWTTTTNFWVYEINTSGVDVSNFNAYFGTLGGVAESPASFYQRCCDISYDVTSNKLLVLGRGAHAGSGNDTANFVGMMCTKSGTFSQISLSLISFDQNNRGLSFYSPGLGYMDIVDDNDYLLIQMQDYGVAPQNQWLFKRVRPEGMGTRALLDTPINKTDQQTLRITYQMDYA